MQIKRVKVTKASSKCYWYADKIGNEFYVFNVGHDDDKFKHQVIRVGTYDSLDMSPQVSYLDTEDFEVIEVFDGEIVEQVITSIERSDKTQCEENQELETVSDKRRYTTSEVVEMLRNKSIELGSKHALSKAACVEPGFLSLVLSGKHDPNYILVRYLGLKRMVYFYHEGLEPGDELKQNDKEFVEYEKSSRKMTKKLNSRDRKIAGLQRKVALLESILARRTIDLQNDIRS